MSLDRKPKVPSARYILKRVAFHVLQQGYHLDPRRNDLGWDRMIRGCAEAHANSPREYTVIYERASVMLTRTRDELTRVHPKGEPPTDLDVCYNLLVEV